MSPLIARVYSPEDFGMLALYMSVVGFLLVLSTGKYELAIVKESLNENAKIVVAIVIFNSLFFSLILLSFYSIIQNIIENINSLKAIGYMSILFPLSVAANGLYQAFYNYAVQQDFYKEIAKTRVFYALITVSIQLLLGTLNLEGGLIYGGIVSQILSGIILVYFCKIKNHPVTGNKFLKKVRYHYKKHFNFPRYIMPNALFDIFSISATTLILSHYFGNYYLGLYAFAIRLLQAPIMVVGGAVSQVFYREICKIAVNKIHGVTIKLIVVLVGLALVMYLFMYNYSVHLFVFVFGDEWRESGQIAGALSFWLSINLITSPISTIPLRLDKQKIAFYMSIVTGTAPILLILSCVSFFKFNFNQTIEVMSYSMGFLLIGYLMIILSLTYKEKFN